MRQNTIETRDVSGFLSHAVLQSALGIPMGDVRGFYLDVLLSSSDTVVRLTGAASELPDRTEAFLLTASSFDPSQRWTGPAGEPGWEAENLLGGRNAPGQARILLGPRSVRYFYDPEDRNRGLTVLGPFDSAAAIEFRPAFGSPTPCLVVYATPEYPCAIEVASTLGRRDEILAALEEFVPQSAGTVAIRGR